jgi:hypothetical protein
VCDLNLRDFLYARHIADRAFQSYKRIINLKKIFACALALLINASGISADPVGVLLDQVTSLNNSEITDQSGFLFQSWLQMDEDNLRFVIYLDGRKYDAILDDGRGTSQRAALCKKENVFDEDPRTGCPLSFDAEYLVEDNGGTIEISLKIWNVAFQN